MLRQRVVGASGPWPVIPFIRQYAAAVPIWVIILTRLHRIDEGSKPHTAKDQGNRDKIGQDIHRGYLSRSAFSDTVIEELDMANAAINGVANPATASGTAMML